MTETFSQAGQDQWVLEQLGGKLNGTFLDVGCHHPRNFNNTWLLERDYGWRGLGLDADDQVAAEWRKDRQAPFVWADARKLDWVEVLERHGLPLELDYLSLDVDEAQLETVQKFPWSQVRFQLLTVEHDSYRFGILVRDKIRQVLQEAGYEMDEQDVALGDEVVLFEDWWVVTRNQPGQRRHNAA